MRRLVLTLAAAVSVGGMLHADVLEFASDSEISAPRLASGDLDGDGVDELVAGGRVGPFLPATAPAGRRRAAIEVSSVAYLSNGLQVPRIAARFKALTAVEDVAAGDVDGDGASEILAVGDGHLLVLSRHGSQLEVAYRYAIPGGRLWRVAAADVDGDGRDEVAVAITSAALSEGDYSSSAVTLYGVDGHLSEEASLLLDGHIGDLCFGDFDGNGRAQLALELGHEEIGGRVQVYGVGGGLFEEQVSQRLTAEDQRVLGLAAVASNRRDLLALAPVRGPLSLARQMGDRMIRVAQYAMPPASSPVRSLVALIPGDPARGAHLLSAGGPVLWHIAGLGR